jgi:hypothetical protein
MDFQQFNIREASERGAFMPLRHPITGDLLGEGDDAPGFIVRGTASKSAQARFAEMRRKAKAAEESAAKKAAQNDDEGSPFEEMHKQSVESAMDYIIAARNIEMNGEAVTSDEQILAFLDMTFPEMEPAIDKDGNPQFMGEGKDLFPRLELTNFPFAKQVLDFAGKQENFINSRSNG